MRKYREAILYSFTLIILLVVALILVKPKIGGIIRVEKDLQEKTVQIADLERQLQTLKQAAEIPEDTTKPDQVKKIYKPETASTEAESSFTVPFDDIIDMAKYNGIKIYSIEYVYNPTEDDFVKNASVQYNVCQVNMQIVSDYADLESFLKELYKYPSLINIDKLEITPYPKNKKILLSVLQLKLYASK